MYFQKFVKINTEKSSYFYIHVLRFRKWLFFLISRNKFNQKKMMSNVDKRFQYLIAKWQEKMAFFLQKV